MSKVLISKLSSKETRKMQQHLCSKMASLKTKKQIEEFLEDVLTDSEIIMLLRRLQIAKLLLDGNTYFEIREKLGVGVDTIKNVRYKLEKGSGGYLNFIKKL